MQNGLELGGWPPPAGFRDMRHCETALPHGAHLGDSADHLRAPLRDRCGVKRGDSSAYVFLAD